MISYQVGLEGLSAQRLGDGFFVGWPAPPSAGTFWRALQGSSYVVVALVDGQVVGFVNAISDGVLAAFIPMLEVLPEFQQQGVGSELVNRMLALLGDLYSVDLVCDPDVVPFYERWGLQHLDAMGRRNRSVLAG